THFSVSCLNSEENCRPRSQFRGECTGICEFTRTRCRAQQIFFSQTEVRDAWKFSERTLSDGRYFKVHKSASNARNLFSNSHCCCAFWFAFRKPAHALVGFSLPSVSFAQSLVARTKLSCFSHKLFPGKNACSIPVRAIFFKSAYFRL